MIDEVEKIKLLAEKLSGCSKVTRYNTAGDDEAWTLSHDLVDLEESFRKITDNFLPKLLNEKLTEEETEDTLWDIGEEFRHILYHIGNNKYFDYLKG